MSEKTPRDHDTRGTDALRDLLRAADPAGAAAQEGLDPIERANLRQRITAAAGQDLRVDAWSPGGSAAHPSWRVPAVAAAALVTAVGLALWSLDGGPAPTSDPVTGNVAATPVAPAVSPGADAVAGQPPGEGPATMATDPDATSDTAVAQATATDAAEMRGTAEPADIDEPADPAASTAAPVATPIADNPSPPDRQARTVQFVAPRGTRIIWTLDPNFESPIAGQEPRQEKTQ